MKQTTLTNDFHKTEAKVKPTQGGFLNRDQVKRVRKKLCGKDGCCCGVNVLSTRGDQFVIIEDCNDGTCQLSPMPFP